MTAGPPSPWDQRRVAIIHDTALALSSGEWDALRWHFAEVWDDAYDCCASDGTPRLHNGNPFRDDEEPAVPRLRAVLAEHAAPSDPPQDERCTRCHGDQGWHGGHGAWEPCPDCDPPQDDDEAWNRADVHGCIVEDEDTGRCLMCRDCASPAPASADTEGVRLTEEEKSYGRSDPGLQWRGRWYSEASVERILAARLCAATEGKGEA